jgi:alkylation response protein AidB-like acyl-CoA dehydrogenase
MSAARDPVAATLREMAEAGALDLPTPGRGATAERHIALFELTRRRTVAVGRLAEAHTDAVAIVREAGLDPHLESLYGVWASERPGASIRLDTSLGTVDGSKPFCSGLGIVDRALITALDGQGQASLVEVDVATASTVSVETSGWSTPALATSATGTVTFDHHPIERVVSPEPDWYLQRRGFWHGACGPAACWAGGAVALVDHARAAIDTDPHRLAHLGAMEALAWGMTAVLEQAGREIDLVPDDVDTARRRALSVRHLVERSASEILDRFGRALGPRPFVGDPDISQRFADVHLYLRQDHAERDLAVLGENRDRSVLW